MSAVSGDGQRRRSWFRRIFRRGLWEPPAMAIMGVGVIMMTQPVSPWLYGESFTFVLVGTLGHLVASHFPE